MISLKEALIGNTNNVDVVAVAAQDVEQFIQKYTNLRPKGYKIRRSKGNIVVDVKSKNFEIHNWQGETLTDGFAWGEFKGALIVINCPNLKSVKEFPETFKKLSIVLCPKLEELPPIPVKCDDVMVDRVGIKNLEGFPANFFKGSICVSKCDNFESLEGVPKDITGSLDIIECPKFNSLKGCPNIGVGYPSEGFNMHKLLISECPIKSLEGMNIDELNGLLELWDCPELSTLKGIPSKEVKKLLIFKCDKLKSFDFLPEKVPYNIICEYCRGLESAGVLHEMLKKYKNADEVQSTFGELMITRCLLNDNSAELSKLEKAGLEIETDYKTVDGVASRPTW